MANDALFNLLEGAFTNSQYMEGDLPGKLIQEIESALLEIRGYEMLGVRGREHEILRGKMAVYHGMQFFYSKLSLGLADKPGGSPLEAAVMMYFGEVKEEEAEEVSIELAVDVPGIGTNYTGPANRLDSIGLVAILETGIIVACYMHGSLEELPITRVWYPLGKEVFGELPYPSTVVKADQDMRAKFKMYIKEAEGEDEHGNKGIIPLDEAISQFTDTTTYRAVLDFVMFCAEIYQRSSTN